jgi:hypothetical protein
MDRDKIVVRWIEQQQTEAEDEAPQPPPKIVEMPTSHEERQRRLKQTPRST